MALNTMLLRILMKCHRLYIRLEYYFCSVIFRTTFSLTLLVLISQRAPFCFKPKLSQKWPTIPYSNSRQHKEDTLAVQINPYWTYI